LSIRATRGKYQPTVAGIEQQLIVEGTSLTRPPTFLNKEFPYWSVKEKIQHLQCFDIALKYNKLRA